MLPFIASFPGLRNTGGTTGYPVIESSTSWSDYPTQTTSKVVTLPSGIASGDLVILALTCAKSPLGVTTVSTPSGWTQLATTASSSRVSYVFYIIASGAMSNVTVTAAASVYMSTISYRISNFSETPEAVYSTNTTSTTTPNTANLTPTWGSDTTHTLWFSIIGFGVANLTSVPSGYSSALSGYTPTNGSYAGIHGCYKTSQAASEDPGNWVWSAAQSGLYCTLGVKGAVAA